MTTVINMEAESREATGKGAARSLRREGKIPGIIYGPGAEKPVQIAVEQKEIAKQLQSASFMQRIFALSIGNDTIRALPKDVQLHPVTDIPEHIDFFAVKEDQEVCVSVAVKFLNRDRCPGLRRGGNLNIVRRSVELVCMPGNIPDYLELDLSRSHIGQSLHISHITLPENVRPAIEDRDFTIAAIVGRGGKSAGAGEEGEGEEAAEE